MSLDAFRDRETPRPPMHEKKPVLELEVNSRVMHNGVPRRIIGIEDRGDQKHLVLTEGCHMMVDKDGVVDVPLSPEKRKANEAT